MKLSAAMAMTPRSSESRESEAKRMDGRWASAGWRGVHDSVDDLMSGANTSVWVPNGSQVLRPVGHDGGQSSPSEFALLSDRAT